MEGCPLGVTTPLRFMPNDGPLPDRDGFIWDTEIPNECWSCIHSAIASSAAITETFEPEIFEGEDEERLDKELCHGIKKADEGPGRIAKEEFSIEGGETYSMITAAFSCAKES